MRMMRSVLAILFLLSGASFAYAKDLTLQKTPAGWQTSTGIAAADDLLAQYLVAKSRQSSKPLIEAISEQFKLVKGFDVHASSKDLYRLKVLADDGQGKIKLGLAAKCLADNVLTEETTITVDKLFLGKNPPIGRVLSSPNLLVLIAKVKDSADDYVALLINRRPVAYAPDAVTTGTVLEIEDLGLVGGTVDDEEMAIGQIKQGSLQIVSSGSRKKTAVNTEICNPDYLPPITDTTPTFLK